MPTSKELSMKKQKTHFPQVPVEVAKKAAQAESNGKASELPKQLKKSPKGNAVANH